MSAKQMSLPVRAEDAADRIARETYAALVDARKADKDFRLTAETFAAALRPALERELPKVAREGKRNPLFDALAEGCGLSAPLTKSAAGQVAVALKEIREAHPAVSADDLRATAAAVRRKYADAGPIAVSAHWHEFQRERRPVAAQQTAPAGWLAKLNELYPESTLARGGCFAIERETEYQWNQLDRTLRATLTAALYQP